MLVLELQKFHMAEKLRKSAKNRGTSNFSRQNAFKSRAVYCKGDKIRVSLTILLSVGKYQNICDMTHVLFSVGTFF